MYTINSSKIWILDKPERWQGLIDIEPHLPAEEFFDLFAEVWSNSESNDRYIAQIDQLVTRREISAEKVMPCLDEGNQNFYNSLADEMEIYRGSTMENPYCDYSWTTDRNRAVWFSKRCYEATPALITGEVKKTDILFAFDGRGEKEIAVQTDKVTNRRIKRAGRWQRNEKYKFYAAVQSGDVFSHVSKHGMEQRVIMAGIAGLDPTRIKNAFYKEMTELEEAGFSSGARKRREILESIDWKTVMAEAQIKMKLHHELKRQQTSAA